MDISCLTRADFAPNDFFNSTVADKNGITNLLSDGDESAIILQNLSKTADLAQSIRDLLRCPVIINSGYRCQILNNLVGGKPNSQHLIGQAIDFVAPDFGVPADIITFLKQSSLEVDQCLMEGTWIHASIKDSNNRNEFATYLLNPITNKREFQII